MQTDDVWEAATHSTRRGDDILPLKAENATLLGHRWSMDCLRGAFITHLECSSPEPDVDGGVEIPDAAKSALASHVAELDAPETTSTT